MNKVCFLDLDGIICNFVQGLIDFHGLNIHHDDWTCWNFHRQLGMTDNDLFGPTENGTFWRKLKPYPWANRVINRIEESGYKIIFATSPNQDPKCASQKVHWLIDHGFMEKSSRNYNIGHYKEYLSQPGTILVDDKPENCQKFDKGLGNAHLFEQPWNSSRPLWVARLTNLDIFLNDQKSQDFLTTPNEI